MRILFFTLVQMTSINDRGIYADMVKEFIKKGHHIDYFFPLSKPFTKNGENYSLNSIVINQKIQKTKNFILKYLSYKKIEKYLSKTILNLKDHYDLLIIATPSIFQSKIVKTFKYKFQKSKVLLLLKDIFPDNALDLNIIKKYFPYTIIYKYFRKIENNLYKNVDKIGLMTRLNQQYFISRNKEFSNKQFISPNSLEFYDIPKIYNRSQLSLPEDKIIVTFIGNIGLPQSPNKIYELINNSPKDVYFVLIGNGTMDSLFKSLSSEKLLFINELLPQEKVDQYLINSNLGLVVLNSKFNVPNFPSKILSYLNAKLPILAITNEFNDLKDLIKKNHINGIWLNSNITINSSIFSSILIEYKKIKKNDIIISDYLVENQISNLIKNVFGGKKHEKKISTM